MTSPIARGRRAVHGALTQAMSFIFPSPCVVCGDIDGPVCVTCAPPRQRHERRLGSGPESLVCFSGGTFTRETGDMMAAFKEHGVTRIARSLAPLLRDAVDASGERLEEGGVHNAVFVPIPTRRAADRSRGFRPVDVLIRHAELRATPALRVVGHVRDQRDLSRQEREQNTHSAFATRRLFTPTHPVILVDDVVTTGATLLGAARVLRAAGASVVAAVTALHTPKRR